MHRIDHWLLFGVAWMLGCSSEGERSPPLGDCIGPGCAATSPPSSTPQPEGGLEDDRDGAAGVATVDLQGRIVRFVDSTFSGETAFQGSGKVRVFSEHGDDEVSFSSDATPGYSASGVVTGGAWFTVLPNNVHLGQTRETHAYLHVPFDAPHDFSIPVIDTDLLTDVYASIDFGPVVDGYASVIVVFERDGQRASGVTVSGHPTAHAKAYDCADGFCADATATGANGVLVLANVTGSAKLEWTDRDGTPGSLDITHSSDRATFARVRLP